MHAIYVRDLESRRPGIALAVDIEDAASAERLVRSIACSYPKHGRDGDACWFRDGDGLHRIWSEPQRDALSSERRGAKQTGAQPRARSCTAAA